MRGNIIQYFLLQREATLFNQKDIRLPFTPHKQSKSGKSYGGRMGVDEEVREYRKMGYREKKLYRYYLDEGKLCEDVIDIQSIQSEQKKELIILLKNLRN